MTTFTREDWTLFRTLGTLSQKAGVAADKLPRLVAKELADNALDVAGAAEIGLLPDNGFFVADRGDGIPGDDQAVADLFSIARPLVSSKLLRLPSRGALGNGLRVVAGAVLATDGKLAVATNGRRLHLKPQDDGSTAIVAVEPYERKGTRIDVYLGDALTVDDDALRWASDAAVYARGGEDYKGKTSPHWYDADAFFELLQAANSRPVRDIVADLDGCSGAKAGKIAQDFLGRSCDSMTREEAEALLAIARRSAKPVKARRLGRMGEDAFIALTGDHTGTYAVGEGEIEITSARGDLDATIPFVVEAFVSVNERGKSGDDIRLDIAVNKTPMTADARAMHRTHQRKNYVVIFGAGLSHRVVDVGRIYLREIVLNIITPYMPITSDGKAPDLMAFLPVIRETIEKAVRRAKRGRAGRQINKRTLKDVVFDNVEDARLRVSSDGRYRFSLRQMFYALRPVMIEATGKEPEYKTFAGYITEYENIFGDIPGMYRDPRGTLYHPHRSERFPIGTLTVEQYDRPDWTFNKILYIEKEGFFELLIEEQWPERHDCALLTSKGYASRATKDLLDLLGETDEELVFFCAHDADAYGTTIYHTLQEETAARPGRKVKIINIGLDPWEARDMGLDIEPVARRKERRPVGGYVDPFWVEWLQSNRVELNAMTSDVFLAWLDRKMEEFGQGKLVPPATVTQTQLETDVEEWLRRRLTDRILEEADLDAQVDDAFDAIKANGLDDIGIDTVIAGALYITPAQSWRKPVEETAKNVVDRYLLRD